MVLGSFFFKHKARLALKGNWQTALVVTFFAGIFTTLAQVVQSVLMKDISALSSSFMLAFQSLPADAAPSSQQYMEVLELARKLTAATESIPPSMWALVAGLMLLALVLTPVLSISLNRYFIARIDGEELGAVRGLTCRLPSFLRALWLHVIMFVRIFLWSLLFLIPGILAALRYSMAPYYLAENPDMKASEAIRRSKESMKNMKMTYFMLQLSFIGWNLLVNLVQLLLLDISPVVSLVAAQFLSLAVATYLNAANAVFYTAVSRPDGVEGLVREARRSLKQMGMDDSAFDHETLDDEPSDGGDDE